MGLSFKKVTLLSFVFLFTFMVTYLDAQETKKENNKWIELLASKKKSNVDKATKELLKDKVKNFPILLNGLNHSQKQVRQQCLKLLATYNNKKSEIITILSKKLSEETQETVLVSMLQILTKWKATNTASEVVKLINHASAETRAAAIYALTYFQSKNYAKKIVERVKTELSPEVKVAIFRALTSFKNKNDIISAISTFPESTYEEEKEDVLKAICDSAHTLNTSYGFDILANIAKGSSYPGARQHALTLLISQINKSNVDVLIDILWDEDIAIRSKAFRKLMRTTLKTFNYNPKDTLLERTDAIGRWEKWRLVHKLLPELEKADTTQAASLRTQIMDSGNIARNYLLKEYAKSSQKIKSQIIKMLSKWHTPEVITLLGKATKEGGQIEDAAIASLIQLQNNKKSKAIIAILQEVFGHARNERRLKLAGYLASQEDEKAVQFLIAQLKTNRAQALKVIVANKVNANSLSLELLNNLKSKDIVIQKTAFDTIIALDLWSILLSNYDILPTDLKINFIYYTKAKYPKSLDVFVAKLAKEKDEKVLFALCDVLSLNTKAKAHFLKILENKTSEKIERVIIHALKKQKALHNTIIINLFLKKKNEKIQLELLNALVQDEEKKLKEFLLSVVFGQYNEKIRTKAFQVLLSSKSSAQNLNELINKLAKEKSVSLRLAWIEKLEGKVKEENFSSLKNLAKANNDAVQRKSIRLMKNFPYAKMFPLFKDILDKETDKKVITTITNQLIQYKAKHKEIRAYLETLLEQKQKYYTRLVIIEAIIKLNNAKGFEILTKEIKGKNFHLDHFKLLIATSPREAKKSVATVFNNIKYDSQKIQAIKMGSAIFGPEHIDLFLDMFLLSSNKALKIEIGKLLDSITGLKLHYDPLKSNQDSCIKTWRNWKSIDNEIDALVKKIPTDKTSASAKKLLSYGERGTTALIKAVKNAKNAKNLIAYIKVLGENRTSSTIATIRQYIHDPAFEIRSFIYSYLGKAGDKNFLENLPLLYLEESNIYGRVVLMKYMSKEQLELYKDDLLGYMKNKDEKVLPLVLSLLVQNMDYHKIIGGILNNADERTQLAVLKALVGSNNTEDIYLIASILEKTKSKQINTFAPSLFNQYKDIQGKIKDTKAFLLWWKENKKEITKSMNTNRMIAKYLYGNSYDSLMAKKSLEKLDPKTKDIVVQKLIQEANTKNIVKQEKILELLTFYGSKQAKDLFLKSLDSEYSKIVYLGAKGLYHIGYKNNEAEIEKAFENKDAIARFYAVRAMGESHDKNVLPKLEKALNDSDVRVREEALYWAKELGMDNQEKITQMLKDKGPAIRTIALEMAQKYNMKKEIPKCIAYLNDPFPSVRKAAYAALLQLSGQKILYNHTDEAKKRIESIKQWQIWWIKHSKQEEVKTLANRLTEEGINKEKVRAALISLYEKARGKLQEAVLKQTLEMLDDPRGIVRLEATKALAKFKVRHITQNFVKLLNDPDVHVRNAALAGIGELTNTKIKLKPVSDKDWEKQVTTLKEWWNKEKQKSKKTDNQLIKKIADAVKSIDKAEALAKKLIKFGPNAVKYLVPYLKNSKASVVQATILVLLELNGYENVATIIPLIAEKEHREFATKSLEKFIGTKIPYKSGDALSSNLYLSKVVNWWDKTSTLNKDKALDTIEKLLNELDKTKKIGIYARKLADLGPAVRSDLEEYLADRRSTVKNGIILALGYLRDARAIPALMEYLKDPMIPIRMSVLSAIRLLSGEEFGKDPVNEKQWNELVKNVEAWQAKSKERKLALKTFIEKQREKLANPVTKADAVKLIVLKGAMGVEFILPLLKDPKVEIKTAALGILKEINDPKAVSHIIPLLGDSNEFVKKLAYDTLSLLTKSKLPKAPDNKEAWNISLKQTQTWWNKKLGTIKETKKKEIKSIVKTFAQDKRNSKDTQKTLEKLQIDVTPFLLTMVSSADDTIRLGSTKILGLYGKVEALSSLLLDPNLKVRKAAYDAIVSKASEKPPVVFDSKEAWEKEKNSWAPNWVEKDQKVQQQAALESLKKEAKAISNISQIWLKEQLISAKNTAKYLTSPYAKVRLEAFKYLKRIGKETIAFNDTKAEERKKDIADINEWLKDIEKDIESELKGVSAKLALIKDNGDLFTPEGCEILQNTIDEMLKEENKHPLIQKRYVEILKSKGCNLLGYDIYADSKKRKEVLYKIGDKLFEKADMLKAKKKKALPRIEKLKTSFLLDEIKTPADLTLAKQLVQALSDPYYGIRKKAIDTLFGLGGNEDKEYDPKKAPEKQKESISNWNEWIKTEEKALEEIRKVYREKIIKTATTFKPLKDKQDLEKISLLIAALSDKEQKIREVSSKALVSITKDAFTYKPSIDPEKQIDALKKWKQWFEAQLKIYEEQKELNKAAYYIKNSGKIETSVQVKKLELLVKMLNSDSVQNRKTAFSALSEYARKHAMNEVREDFGYDPIAPEKIRVKTSSAWKKWFHEKVVPVAQKEAQTIKDIKLWEKTLNSKFTSQEDFKKVSLLVSYLQSQTFEIRKLAIGVLKKLAGEDYGFTPEKSLALQKNPLELWKIWLQIKKEGIKPVKKVETPKKVEQPKKVETPKKVEQPKKVEVKKEK